MQDLFREQNAALIFIFYISVAIPSIFKVLELVCQPCNNKGFDLPPNASPPPSEPFDPVDNYFPFANEQDFHLADFLFTQTQMSAGNIDILMNLWASRQESCNEEVDPPYAHARDLYSTINSIPLGDTPWEGFKVTYDGDVLESSPSWMTKEYEVWYWNPLEVMEAHIGNPDFAQEIDYAPKQVIGKNRKRQYTNLMSGQWAWEQADILAADPETHGAMFAPIILGSDKTTVSVATGQNDYYPLYASLGNVQNHVRQAHRNALTVIGSLAMPKNHQDSAAFRQFRRQLFHSSLARILMPLKPWMEKPRITCCGDGHYHRVIYGLGPYIADYPEQCLLACIVSGWCPRCTAPATNLDGEIEDAIQRSHDHTKALHDAFNGNLKELWEGYRIIGDIVPFTVHFPRANIHELLSPDLLHQIIKGTFKDHLVTWVIQYFESQPNGKISVVPPFSGLRRFPEGRGFKQWTSDDSKALMKVFLPAIYGLVPNGMVCVISTFLDFCYLVRRSSIDETVLTQIDAAVKCFHNERQIFLTLGIRDNFLLPRQHSLLHYRSLIQMFGAPNGICSSITESKHIKAVKEPWRRSSRNNPIREMLCINQRLDKLAAARVDFNKRGMLGVVQGNLVATRPPLPTSAPVNINIDKEGGGDVVEGETSEGTRNYPKSVAVLSEWLNIGHLEEYIRRFLFDQQNPDSDIFGMDIGLDECPKIPLTLCINIFHSAIAIYHAPSDLSGTGGMHHEYIQSTCSWKNGPARHNCVFVEQDPDEVGFWALGVAQVQLFFSFEYDQVLYPCALVRWFETYGNAPCPETGMWMVQPDVDVRLRQRICSVIHIDSILRAAHLIGVYSLHAFKLFYVNKYADHHSHEIAF
ncbi:hypothetical protein BYT27DRAFT_7223998 [Phlegmacium glaucopus]|nr:hypothetical protein BYT27DRAFT_7223998 [Phlegmacium glaucopus]